MRVREHASAASGFSRYLTIAIQIAGAG